MSGQPSKWQRGIRWSIIAGVIALLLWSTRFQGSRLIEITGSTMGTTYTIKLITDTQTFSTTERAMLESQIDDCLDQVNRRMSTYLPDSELSQLNKHADTTPFRLSEDTFHVFRRAMQVSEESGGVFDITVGPIVNAYGFGPDPERADLPSEEELKALKERVGYRYLELDTDNRTVRKLRPDLYCDLSAIAKGYGVDQVAELLNEWKIRHYMVEIGGEIKVRGRNADGRPWRIGIEKPVSDDRAIERMINVFDRAVATSGDYRNFYMKDGKRISHTIDPRIGRPVSHNLASVTVLHEDCELADAWATALDVLGPEEGYNLAEKKGLAAMFIIRERDGIFVEKMTASFTAFTGGAESGPG